MFYIIYKITNILNNKIYIGCHKTDNIDDGYMGSGKLIRSSIQKYGLENFKKEILFTFENEELMYRKEQELVNEDFVNLQSTYNLCIGGNGGWSYINSNSIPKMLGKRHSDETKNVLSEKNKHRKCSELTKQKISDNNKITNASRSNKVKEYFTGKPKSPEHRAKISNTLKNKQKISSIDYLEKQQKIMAYARSLKPEITVKTKEKISNSLKKSWANGGRIRPVYDWSSIQEDINNGFKNKDLIRKYDITKNIIDNGIKRGYITRQKSY